MNDTITLAKGEYRPDINGLRAVAVILVLLFHLEVHFVKAGFLGVDVFLVISGYLISRHILYDLNLKKFSFRAFYIKRFKRLFPALFVTLLLSLVAGFLTLTPANLEQLSKTVVSGILFSSNIFFFRETGYFDTESAFKPLLHIWSLSLEEQFYFVWPLLLLLIFKASRKAVFLSILALIVLSIVTASSYIAKSPDAVFYLLPFRFFEFLLGALCIWLERYRFRFKIVDELALLSGLALIFYSAISFTLTTPMPGTLSLIPCGGAMLVIYGGNTKYGGFLLRNKLAELIGKSSYSIYLVHWPIIVYYKFYTLSELTRTSKELLGAASLLLGLIMWKLVENTFRRSELKLGRIDAAWIWIPVLMIALTLASWRVWVNKGYPSRYSAEFTMTEDEIAATRNRYWEGSNSEMEVLQGTDDKKIIVMGNSFAIDLMYALRKNGLKAKIISLQTSHRCFNFGAAYVNQEDTAYCGNIKNINLADTNWAKADAIYLFDHWLRTDLDNLSGLLKDIRKITKAPVYVFGPKMVFLTPVPEIVRSCKSASAFAINKYAQQYAEIEERSNLNNTLITFFQESYWKQNKIYYVDVLKILRGEKNQFDIISPSTSEFLYFDRSHYTDQGAKEFGEKLKASHPDLYTP